MHIEETTINDWVDASAGEDQRAFREAVHTILSGIANDPILKATMVIKGGILLAIRYRSHRYTKDIDFSTDKPLEDVDIDDIVDKLDKSMAVMTEKFDYDMECRIQSCKVQPPKKPDAKYPSIKIKIGYAYKFEAKHKRLLAGKCPTTIDIDYSLNEYLPNIEEFDIAEDESLTAYSLTDLISEKLRSVLQQKKRERQRRQDIFDLYLLLEKFSDLDKFEKAKILDSLIAKARSREIEPDSTSFRDSEIKERSKAQYHTLEDEIEGQLPDFDEIYLVVQRFYESLPWQ
ncbi:MAG: nucleotidyl transferase AbiEii/AbiGii toxin family protein [Candidatus Thiodiazotropha sp.]